MKITIGPLLTTTLTYAVLGILGLVLAIPPGYASPVFPAAGLAVALALYFGNRILPGIWLGSLTLNLVVAWQHGSLSANGVGIAAVVASGAVLQAWVARWIILRWLDDKWRRLETEKDVVRFLVAGAPLACLTSATIGICALYVAGSIPAEEFFYSWLNWWTGDTIGVLIFSPLTLIVLFRKDSFWKERRRAVAVPMLAMIGLVIVAFSSASYQQKKQQINQIEEHGMVISSLLDKRFAAHQEALAALKRLIEVIPDMTFAQFEYFTQITLQDNTDIFALSFNPYILDSSRSAFEQSMTMVSMAPFSITERNSQKQLGPAPERKLYVPVGFIAPLEGNQPAIGFNIHSEPIRRDAIERAFTSKRTAVTAPIQLVQEAQMRIGVLVLTPAYRKSEPPGNNGIENLIGFAVGVFKIDTMVKIATQNRVPAGFVFRLTDTLAAPDRNLIFQSDEGQNKPQEPYVWRSQLTMADRLWHFEIFPTEEYLRHQHSVLALAVCIVGLLFASLLQIMLLAMTGRTFVIQQKVNAQTAQLSQSIAEIKKNEHLLAEKIAKLELVLEGAQLGTWSWDIVDDQFEFNERFNTMLGYQPGELKPHLDTLKELLHPNDRVRVFAVLESHLAGDTPFFFTEHRLRHKSGQWIWVHNTGKVLQRNSAGGPQQAFGIHLDITERKEAGRLLTQAKEESDAIIRNFLDTLIVVNTSLIVVRVNLATCHLLGYTNEELIGKNVTELFHDSKLHIRSVFAFYKEQDYHQLADKAELRNIELCYRHKNGERLPMSFNISLLQDDDGAATGVVAGAKDISHLRLALDKIARQKEYIETIFDIVPEGLLALSPSREVVKRNLAFEQILHIWSNRLGLTQEEFTHSIIERVLDRQDEKDTFTLHFGGDDATAYFKCTSTLIFELDNVAAVVPIEDITDERKAQEATKLLATVIEQTDDSILITGTDEVIHYINPAGLQNSGFSKNELIGPNVQVFTNGLINASVITELRETLAKGQIWHGHFTSRKKNDSIIEEDVTISPIRNQEGALTHYVIIKRDITEMANLQRQLLQAQKLEAIGQLAAGIAHEINTPMQYVQNNVTFIDKAFGDLNNLLVELGKTEKSLLTAKTTTLLETINLDFLLQEIPESIRETHDGINRVVKIVSAMKEFSHPGGNEKIACDLNCSLENTIIVCRNEWKYLAEMVTDFDQDLPLVSCFIDQMNQVTLNLIINAAHAIEANVYPAAKGALGQISVTTRREGDWAVIQIGDTGCGIPEEIQQRIFDPFFTTKEVGKGTGQGLAIVHDIVVNKHGGRIDFTSNPGQGTTFFIRLPITGKQQ